MTLSQDDQEAFRRIIRQEILCDGVQEVPRVPPADEHAEQVLLAAVLNNEHKPGKFRGLDHEHFSEPLKRSVWKMATVLANAGLEPKLPPILTALREQGFSGPVARDLVNIRDTSPSVSMTELSEYAQRITELWRRRRLLETIGRLRVELECGAVTHVDACERLQRYIVDYTK